MTSPFDMWAGNDRLALLQMIAKNQRYVDPAAQQQPIRVGAAPATPRQGDVMPESQPVVLRARSHRPIAPEMRQGAETQRAPVAPQQGLPGILQGLSQQERQQLLFSTLGSAAGNLSNLLAQRPNAGIGEVLLAAGGGALGGRAQALQGIRLGRTDEMRGQLLQRQISAQEAKTEQERAKAEQIQRILDDPTVPEEQKRILQWSIAGVPAAGIEAMLPPEPPSAGDRYRVVGSDLYDLTAEGGPQMVARGTRDAGPLVPIFDPQTGQTTYGTREQAVGQMAPPKGGMTVYDPQTGQPIVQTGVTPGQGLETMQKPTAAALEKSMVQLGDRMERLNLIAQSYKPEFSQIGTRIGVKWAALKDKFGMLEPEEKEGLKEYSTWSRRAFEDATLLLNEISGAAINEHEFERIKQAMPNPGTGIFDGDSPEEYKAKLDDVMWRTQMAYARLHYYRSQGLPVPDFAAGDSGPVSLEQMPEIIDARGNELEQQLTAQNPDADPELIRLQVDQQLRAEFGL